MEAIGFPTFGLLLYSYPMIYLQEPHSRYYSPQCLKPRSLGTVQLDDQDRKSRISHAIHLLAEHLVVGSNVIPVPLLVAWLPFKHTLQRQEQ